MNNDPTPSSAAGQPSATTSGSHGTDASRDDESGGISAADLERMRKTGLVKKLQFVTHLMKSLDMVVFAEICTLYYME
jgi:hypothetical protein